MRHVVQGKEDSAHIKHWDYEQGEEVVHRAYGAGSGRQNQSNGSHRKANQMGAGDGQHGQGRAYQAKAGRSAQHHRARDSRPSITTTLLRFGQFLAGNRFAKGKAARLSRAWAGRHEEVLKVPFLRSVVVILEVWPESHCPGCALREADVFKTYMAWWCM